MAIIRRAPPRNNFTIISNDIFADNHLSNQACGLLCKLLSKPAHWEVNVRILSAATNGTEKKSSDEAIRQTLKELINLGYVQRKKHSNGRTEYVVFDEPQTDFQAIENKPNQENPNQENPNQENPNQEKPNLDFPDVYKELKLQERTELEKEPPYPQNSEARRFAPAGAGGVGNFENQTAEQNGNGGLQTNANQTAAAVADTAEQNQNQDAARTAAEQNRARQNRRDMNAVPVAEIVELYNQTLGDKLGTVSAITTDRRTQIIRRWWLWFNTQTADGKTRYTNRDDGLLWFEAFFRKVSGISYLVGGMGTGWKANFDWLMTEKNMLSVVEWKGGN